MGNTTARDILLAGSEGAKAVFGPNSSITGMLYGRLGREMAALGEDDGIPQMFRALDILENHFNEDNTSEFVELANDIWDILLSQAKLEDARSLNFRVSEFCAQKLGPDNIITCKYLGDLGFINLSLGNTTEAESVLLGALTRLERTVGGEHAETLRALSNLSSVYRSQSRQEDSIRLIRRVLEIRERTIGPNGWGTLLCMSNLGVLLRQLGADEEAKTVLVEAKRRLEDLLTPFQDIVDLVTTGLRGLEDESDVETCILRAEERLKTINMTDGSLLTKEEATFIGYLASLYSENGRLDDAYRLAKQAGEATAFYNEEGKQKWDFSETLCDIIEKMPGREDELIETCREALGKLDIESDGSKNTIVRREMALGNALLQVGQEEEGVRILMRGMHRAKHLDEYSRAWYRNGFVHLFRHYTHSMLASDNVDSSSKPPEFWDRVIKLVRPEGAGGVF
jgi:tetratricopeptide (TPR) repeat protein